VEDWDSSLVALSGSGVRGASVVMVDGEGGEEEKELSLFF